MNRRELIVGSSAAASAVLIPAATFAKPTGISPEIYPTSDARLTGAQYAEYVRQYLTDKFSGIHFTVVSTSLEDKNDLPKWESEIDSEIDYKQGELVTVGLCSPVKIDSRKPYKFSYLQRTSYVYPPEFSVFTSAKFPYDSRSDFAKEIVDDCWNQFDMCVGQLVGTSNSIYITFRGNKCFHVKHYTDYEKRIYNYDGKVEGIFSMLATKNPMRWGYSFE